MNKLNTDAHDDNSGGSTLIPVKCSKCGYEFHVKPEWRGRLVKCPNPKCLAYVGVKVKNDAPK